MDLDACHHALTPPADSTEPEILVPNAEERGRHRANGLKANDVSAESRSQSGILHADLEGDGLLLRITEALRYTCTSAWRSRSPASSRTGCAG